MIKIAVDGKVLKSFKKRAIIHEYGELFETEVRVYALEEIIAEKFCAILQNIDKLQERGWSRSRACDYYDF
ncbi:MAG: nucleotidyl transferase AbiEii/AbiGii toxin family protein [bacterium]